MNSMIYSSPSKINEHVYIHRKIVSEKKNMMSSFSPQNEKVRRDSLKKIKSNLGKLAEFIEEKNSYVAKAFGNSPKNSNHEIKFDKPYND